MSAATIHPFGYVVPAPRGYALLVTDPTLAELRRGVLAISVLDDLDVVATDEGAELIGRPTVRVSWSECQGALGGGHPESPIGRARLARWLCQRRWVANRPLGDLAERVRPYGVPVDGTLHPGPDWVRHRVLGGALDLGIGVVGLDPKSPDQVVAVAQGVLAAVGAPPGWWSPARRYLEEMGGLAADRFGRDRRTALRPMGDCDVVTLLGSASFRRALVAGCQGMCQVAVPMRARGWLDLSHIDPAFAMAAAAATDEAERGFDRPLLVTADEVTQSPPGGRPARLALRR